MSSIATVWFDLETGGLEDEHPDIQLAALAVRGGVELETFERKIEFAEADATDEALKINSYDREVWRREAIPEALAVGEFSTFLRRYADVEKISKANNPYRVARIGGHNAAGFDWPRLRRLFRRHHLFLPADYHIVDTMQMAFCRFLDKPRGPKSYKLVDLCEYFAIEIANAHDALGDVRMTSHLAAALTAP